MVDGSGPTREFEARNKVSRDDKAPSSSGSVPVKLFRSGREYVERAECVSNNCYLHS